ncbi:hypothetical protein GGF50DRAFT_100951, partial [Schizophyllum commune]
MVQNEASRTRDEKQDRPDSMIHLATLATEAARKSEILGLDGDTLSVDGGQVGVLEERDEVRLSGLLQRHDRAGLEAEILLRDLAHKPLEGQLADEQLCRLLVAADLAEGDSTRAEAMGLLDTASR